MTPEVQAAVKEFVQSGKTGCFLMAVQKSGKPYAVQITAVVDDDFTVRIRSNRESLKAQLIRNNPNASVLIVERVDGIQKNVLIQGNAAVVDSKEAVDALFDAFRDRWGTVMDRTAARFATSVVLTITPTFVRAEGFSTPPVRETYTLRLG